MRAFFISAIASLCGCTLVVGSDPQVEPPDGAEVDGATDAASPDDDASVRPDVPAPPEAASTCDAGGCNPAKDVCKKACADSGETCNASCAKGSEGKGCHDLCNAQQSQCNGACVATCNQCVMGCGPPCGN